MISSIKYNLVISIVIRLVLVVSLECCRHSTVLSSIYNVMSSPSWSFATSVHLVLVHLAAGLDFCIP